MSLVRYDLRTILLLHSTLPYVPPVKAINMSIHVRFVLDLLFDLVLYVVFYLVIYP